MILMKTEFLIIFCCLHINGPAGFSQENLRDPPPRYYLCMVREYFKDGKPSMLSRTQVTPKKASLIPGYEYFQQQLGSRNYNKFVAGMKSAFDEETTFKITVIIEFLVKNHFLFPQAHFPSDNGYK